MNNKKANSILLIFTLLISVLSLDSFAAAEKKDISNFDLPKPAAPVYLMYDAADRTASEGSDALYVVRNTDMSVLTLSADEQSDRDAFLEKYGLYDFKIVMQYDTSLDGTDSWNYTSEWDKEYSAPGSREAAGVFWIGSQMLQKESIFDLFMCASYDDAYSKLEDAIIHRVVPDGEYSFNNFYFDHEGHSLYIRVRYYMEWETYDGENIGERQSEYSEWSDPAVFGKNSNGVTPEAPTEYEAPVISDLKYVQPDERGELGHLTFIQSTPEQVWSAGTYYEMTDEGAFEGLETEISVNGGEWLSYTTVNAWGDWCLWNGERVAYHEEPRIGSDSNVKLRIRFLGTHGPSEWSNVLEINDGGTQQVTEDTGGMPDNKPTDENEKCTLCGFCPVPFGLCIFIWLAIILAILILVLTVILVTKPKKCKNCGEKLKKDDEKCPKCGS